MMLLNRILADSCRSSASMTRQARQAPFARGNIDRVLLTLALVVCFQCRAVCGSLDFELEMNLSPRTNATLKFWMTFADLPGSTEQLAKRCEAGATDLTRQEMLHVVYLYLSRFRFVDAEQTVEKLMAKFGRDDHGLLLLRAIIYICRGDYESACERMAEVEKRTNLVQVTSWRVYIKSAVLHSSDEVVVPARALVTSKSVNLTPLSMSAVLATCLGSKESKSLFELLVRHVDHETLLSNEENIDAYLRLCTRHRLEEEAETVRALQRKLKDRQIQEN